MDWLEEILKDVAEKDVLLRKIEDGIKNEFVAKRDYELLKHENNILNNINNDMKEQIESNEFFVKFNEANEKLESETARLNKVIEDNAKMFMVEREIMKAGGRNAKAIMALLDIEKIKVNERGELEGLDIGKIKGSDPYLFETVEKKVIGTGKGKAEKTMKKEDAFLANARRAAGLKD